MKHFLHLATISAALSLGMTAIASFPNVANAQSEPLLLSQVNFQPPDVTAPGNRQGGTHRGTGACPAGLSITPLVPVSNIGLTVEESPSFFVYIPQTSAKVEFTLLTENEDDVVYETAFKPTKAGVVSVTLPPASGSRKPLEIGKRYVWSFSMVCDPNDRSADLVVKGWVQRITPQPALKSDLSNPDPRARLGVYAKNGLWYETLTTLAELRLQTPNDSALATEWVQLLQSQGLESVANQPLLQGQ
jgi:hypothetical protein